VSAIAPLALTAIALAALDGAARAFSGLDGQRAAIETECRHLIIGMSWLPFVGFVVGGWSLYLFVRRRAAPLSYSWAVDLALVSAAGALGARAYNAFTAEGSYAPYYAAPLVLLAGIVHQRAGERWPSARIASLCALGSCAAGLAAYALVGLYADDSVR